MFKAFLNSVSSMRIVTNIPASSNAPGLKGDVAFDVSNSYMYFCYANNKWTRVQISAF